jgi:hypothetical protein
MSMTGTMGGTALPGRRNAKEGNGSGPGGAAGPGGDKERAGGEPGGHHLLEDKLRPPQPSFPVLARPRLTTLVWLTLDAGDRHDRFWAYLGAGLNRVRPASPALRALAGRRPPALQLARLRVAGELADINGADLACTAAEADAYFAMLGIEVGEAERDEVLQSTEGWMAGLRLAAMRAGTDSGDGAGVTGLAGGEPLVTDYLCDEVLARQEPRIRAFLLRTSLLPAVSGDLADALTGQSGSPRARTLDRLSSENSFVQPVGRGRGDYRYHPLLKDVLTAELHREIPHKIPVLLRRAARWYADHGRVLDSVRSAAAAQDWDYAARVLAQSGLGMVMSADLAELESVLALIPADRAAHDPAVGAAWAALRLWRHDPTGRGSTWETRAGRWRRPAAPCGGSWSPR